ncbi:MAG: Beta-N-acetylhexosaminidase [candidate division BRC1 bacterium ADurb.BinA364]|nr:MAG: Beta-N-acetylhexosaminidase [candidate division BRC1 bacterium ADurb.BinA364]
MLIKQARKGAAAADLPAKPHLRIFFAPAGARPPAARSLESIPGGGEGYRLTIAEASILIEARSAHGLFNGLMTLRQILRNHASTPCLVIEDWPDMAVRGIHMDLKGCTPTVEYMMRLIRQLAEYKINTLLMEYENAVRLDSTPGVEKPSAWSKDDMAALADLARANFIDLMPLVQSLGHVEYILQHEAYSQYRESQSNVQQYCPSLPETFEFWKRQADEVLEMFPETPYFHVGADETRLLGHCRRCKARMKKGEDELDLYLSHMEKVWRHVLQGGRTPIFWDDIVSRNYSRQRIARIPRGVAPMVWIYDIADVVSAEFRTHGAAYGRRELMRHEYLSSPRWQARRFSHWLDEMPRDEWARYRRFVDKPELRPLVHSALYLEMFAERGMELFGASAAKCGSETMGLPNLVARHDNIRAWGRHIARAGGSGVVSTAWSRNASLTHPYLPFDTMWYAMCASAQYYWTAEMNEPERFQAAFDRDFFGVEDDGWTAQIMEAVSSGASAAAERELAKLSVGRNADVFDAFRIAARVQGMYRAIVTALPRHMMSYYLRGKPYAENWDRFSGTIANQIRRAPELRRQAAEYYHRVMLREEAEELLDSQFKFFEEQDLGTKAMNEKQ